MNSMAEAAENVQVNRLVPDYFDPYYPWPVIASVTALRFTLANTPKDITKYSYIL